MEENKLKQIIDFWTPIAGRFRGVENMDICYEFIGTEGHGKKLSEEKKLGAISIDDHDGHRDWIRPIEGYSEAEAVKSYFKNWDAANQGIDFCPVLNGENGRYWIEKEAAGILKFQNIADAQVYVENMGVENWDWGKEDWETVFPRLTEYFYRNEGTEKELLAGFIIASGDDPVRFGVSL